MKIVLRALVAHCYVEISYQKAIEEPHNSTNCEEKWKWERHVLHALGSYDQPLQTRGKLRIRHGWMDEEKTINLSDEAYIESNTSVIRQYHDTKRSCKNAEREGGADPTDYLSSPVPLWQEEGGKYDRPIDPGVEQEKQFCCIDL